MRRHSIGSHPCNSLYRSEIGRCRKRTTAIVRLQLRLQVAEERTPGGGRRRCPRVKSWSALRWPSLRSQHWERQLRLARNDQPPMLALFG
eukprot:scaffold32972_cov28-Tisochrysis_lutea.AAC.12